MGSPTSPGRATPRPAFPSSGVSLPVNRGGPVLRGTAARMAGGISTGRDSAPWRLGFRDDETNARCQTALGQAGFSFPGGGAPRDGQGVCLGLDGERKGGGGRTLPPRPRALRGLSGKGSGARGMWTMPVPVPHGQPDEKGSRGSGTEIAEVLLIERAETLPSSARKVRKQMHTKAHRADQMQSPPSSPPASRLSRDS